mmetsp:Transcript_13741/g.32071  ORF Transcript_13741/g.32071 Transcript_13741/m.32071 type:complete len:319 (+) Transcript_13741:381-1337(+)
MITRTLRLAAHALQIAALCSTNQFLLAGSFSLSPTASTATRSVARIIMPEAPQELDTPQGVSSTALFMGQGVRTRGLEQRREGATPTEGGMTLYLKAAEDGTSAGDCPFAHYVRLILEEKNLPYSVRPCASADDKPSWLLEHYEGKMPCLRHRKEAYVESNVIAAYLDYFFPFDGVQNTPERKASTAAAEAAMDGFFPGVAGYLKDTDSDASAGAEASEKLENLRSKLSGLNEHLSSNPGNNLDGTSHFGILDCRLVPQLYHLSVGIERFKGAHGKPDLATEFPAVHDYLQRAMDRESFQKTQYSPDTIEWGWGNARK